jgi:hypothetical protein
MFGTATEAILFSTARFSLLPLREKVAEPSAVKARSDEGC